MGVNSGTVAVLSKASVSKRKGPLAVASKDAAVVLQEVNKLAKAQQQSVKHRATLEELGISDAREVAVMDDADVAQTIERIVIQAAQSILAGTGFSYDVPSRASSNQLYVPQLERIVLKSAVSNRPFSSTATVRKTAITTRVLSLVHEVLNKRIHITKRDLFYTDVKLFEKQNDSDAVLDDVACMIGCTRTSLNVVASEKGVVIGRVTFRDDGDFIDCTKMGVGGKAIPSLIDRITDLQGDAQFVLLVEKDAAFMRLSEDRFYNQYPCIIITARGQPDVSTRLFLNMVKTRLNIPILGLVDSDPYGLKILSVYLSGSKNMSYDSASLTTSDIKWLGVRPSDLETYNIPKECRLDMTESDIKYGQDLLKEDFIKNNPAWMAELELMLKTKEKAEIQALSNFGFQYLTQTYLPLKLQQGDWI
ncbi:topoisomerase [Capsaspora owczarzaki ATCC 30864]|uniref:DNA topoisomerase (ATP-hydrolyzing) n=1 Tax=Capsaspora owczarzaki (strain ATCC 30864) TaxID=595528 RepID=A0A0D2WMG7_CAPO3|nr:topoisomerase [Capsaspora owczarzaki ATCC 30864]KJE92020.1 topoisomerase [Capsaspora owczarzaki ATCC 30864]|eukprot:XP_004363895.2 topoisomerase [Capsaspora owczarzaki ATCC 30864]